MTTTTDSASITLMVAALRAAWDTLRAATDAINVPRLEDADGEEIETDEEYAARLAPEVETHNAAFEGYNVRLCAVMEYAATMEKTDPTAQPWASIRSNVSELDMSDCFDDVSDEMGMPFDVCGDYFTTAPTDDAATAPTAGIEVKIMLDAKVIADVLCSAWEGGSNYWITNVRKIRPKAEDLVKCWSDDADHYPLNDYPMSKGGALLIAVDGHKNPNDPKGLWRLDRDAIERGVAKLAKLSPHQYANLVNPESGSADACTGDCLLQACLFGEIVFG